MIKETTAFWGDKFIEILNPHKEGHIVRVYPDYWDEKAPSTWVGLTDEEIEASKPPLSNDAVVWELAVEWAEAKLKEKNVY